MKTSVIVDEVKYDIEFEINDYDADDHPQWRAWTKEEDVLAAPEKYFKYIEVISSEVSFDKESFLDSPIKERVLSKLFEEAMEYKKKEGDYLSYHFTGQIPSSAYRNQNFSWVEYDNKPLLVKVFIDKTGEEIEFRQSGEKNRYIKKDAAGEILIDDKGDCVYLTDEEVLEKDIPLFDTSVYAFNKKGECVGYTSDEWGADGVWVLEPYQKRGIGLELLSLHRAQFKDSRKMGQMTVAGTRLVRAYFRKNH